VGADGIGEAQCSGRLAARQSDAGAQVVSLRQGAQQMQSDSVDQQDLMRTAKADEDNYLLYCTSARKRALATRSTSGASLMCDRGGTDGSSPGGATTSSFYFAFAFVLAVASPLGSVMTEYFDPTIRTPDEALDCWKCRCWPGCRRMNPECAPLLFSDRPARVVIGMSAFPGHLVDMPHVVEATAGSADS